MFNSQSYFFFPSSLVHQMMNLQFPLGVQGAACARVGNALGAGETERALLITKITLCLSRQSHPYLSLGVGVGGGGDGRKVPSKIPSIGLC